MLLRFWESFFVSCVNYVLNYVRLPYTLKYILIIRWCKINCLELEILRIIWSHNKRILFSEIIEELYQKILHAKSHPPTEVQGE